MSLKDASSGRLGALLLAGFLMAFGGLALAQHATRDLATETTAR